MMTGTTMVRAFESRASGLQFFRQVTDAVAQAPDGSDLRPHVLEGRCQASEGRLYGRRVE